MKKESPVLESPSIGNGHGHGRLSRITWNNRWAEQLPLKPLAIAVAVLFLFWGASRIYRHSSGGARPGSGKRLSPQAIENGLRASEERLKSNPDDLQAMMETGFLLFQKGKDYYPDAINALDEAWQRGALDERVFYCMGVMYQEEGLYREAIRNYQMYLRNRPADADVRLLLAKLLYQNGRFGEALAEYKSLRKILGSVPAVIVENIGLSLMAVKQNEEASEEFKALRSFGDVERRRAAFYLGQINFEKADYHQAMRDFLEVLPLEGRPELGLSPALVHAAMGENYEKLNVPLKAKEMWSQVLKADPSNSRAKSRVRALTIVLNRKRIRLPRSRRR